MLGRELAVHPALDGRYSFDLKSKLKGGVGELFDACGRNILDGYDHLTYVIFFEELLGEGIVGFQDGGSVDVFTSLLSVIVDKCNDVVAVAPLVLNGRLCSTPP